MSQSVKRYNMDVGKFGNVNAYESEHGRWVRRDDFTRLEQECRRLSDESHRNRVDLVDATERSDRLKAERDAALNQVSGLREALQKFENLGIVVGNKTWPELDDALTTAAERLAKR